MQREPVSRLAEEEQRVWSRVSALVWEPDDSLPVVALPVLLVADEQQVALAADAGQALALRAPVSVLALARVRPGELE